ncbi:MAG: hypothetical protein A2X51_01030 [Candidatus Rokubacteria bacterium GWC2_70_24]|nr:MAG: hypothetical protein A2X51_01030 [Candidatus Rokubacteria bacterium GWC2_70_24]
MSEHGFEEWLLAERERLREAALEALAKLLARQTKAEATERAIQTAVRLLTLDPLQEVVHRALMRLYARMTSAASASAPPAERGGGAGARPAAPTGAGARSRASALRVPPPLGV